MTAHASWSLATASPPPSHNGALVPLLSLTVVEVFVTGCSETPGKDMNILKDALRMRHRIRALSLTSSNRYEHLAVHAPTKNGGNCRDPIKA